MGEDNILAIGCGILEKEVRFLIRKNGWAVEGLFLDSMFHNDLHRLSDALDTALADTSNRRRFVFYGACHPLMNRILERADTFRADGQNCIEMLLGADAFNDALEKGAFFLLEEWANRWDQVLKAAYHHCRPEVVREIFTSDRTHFLAIRTPCTGDYGRRALAIAEEMAVPLRWMDVTLDHLERVLAEAVARAGRG